jgi:RNA polymerase sigma factor (TIGR02999 family)
MEENQERTARLLQRVEAGDPEAGAQLMETLYGELRDLAGNILRGERAGHTLQPTALVHEAWVRLSGEPAEGTWSDRRHFVRTAARAMRRVLVDHARQRNAVKRGRRVEIDPAIVEEILGAFEDRNTDVVELHESLERLSAFDEELAQLVELRFFAGLGLPETAEALDCSISHVQRRWRLARAWLLRDLGGEH